MKIAEIKRKRRGIYKEKEKKGGKLRKKREGKNEH